MKISLYTHLLVLLFIQTKTTVLSQKLSTKQFPEKQMLQAGVWNDTDGNFINAHGGSILYHQGIYYWYGEIKKGKTSPVTNRSREIYRVPASGISCYSSKNLKTWKFEKIALAATFSDINSDLDTSSVIERPKVLYNQKTKQFVMWMHIDNKDNINEHAGVAVSDNPAGPYRYFGSVKPGEEATGDINIFKDNDGSGYLIYTLNKTKTLQISRLANDYLSTTNQSVNIFEGQDRTAPVMFRFADKYYLLTSIGNGPSPQATSYAVADSPMGNWKPMGNPCIGPFSETTFSSQGNFVLPIDAKKGKFLFLADRWNKRDLESSRYLWLPLEVKGDVINITWSAKVPD